jgi:hypothetical protein
MALFIRRLRAVDNDRAGFFIKSEHCRRDDRRKENGRVPSIGYDTPALCLSCNYPLRGLTSPRCPECGHAFDLDDPWTMNVGRPMGRIVRWILTPTGRWTHRLALLASVLSVWTLLLLPGANVTAIFVVAVWLLTFSVRLLRRIASEIIRPIYRQLRRPLPSHWWLPMTLLIATVIAWVLRLPLLFVLIVFGRWMAHDADYLYTQVPMRSPPHVHHVGPYPLSSVAIGPNGVDFYFPVSGAIGYFPEAHTRVRGHLIGPWYLIDSPFAPWPELY